MMMSRTPPGSGAVAKLERELNRLMKMNQVYLLRLREAKGKPILQARIMRKISQIQSRIQLNMARLGVKPADTDEEVIKNGDS